MFDCEWDEKMDVEKVCKFDQIRIDSEIYMYGAYDLMGELLSETRVTIASVTYTSELISLSGALPNQTFFKRHLNFANHLDQSKRRIPSS